MSGYLVGAFLLVAKLPTRFLFAGPICLSLHPISFSFLGFLTEFGSAYGLVREFVKKETIALIEDGPMPATKAHVPTNHFNDFVSDL